MDTVSLDALLRTHVGSTREAGNEAATDEVGETAHNQTTQEAINKSDAYWKPLETAEDGAASEETTTDESRLVRGRHEAVEEGD